MAHKNQIEMHIKHHKTKQKTEEKKSHMYDLVCIAFLPKICILLGLTAIQKNVTNYDLRLN